MSKNYRAELTGCFGCPIDENPTGVLMEAGYAAKNLNYRYLTIRLEDGQLETAMKAVRIFGMRGVNLTIPHKVKVLPYLDELSPAAEIIGAVNTVIVRDRKLIGENTDGKGFVRSLADSGISPAQKNVAILGAGGAARAIAVECALAGASEITIINRTPARGEELARLVGEKTAARARFLPWTDAMAIPENTDILVQATNIGLFPDASLPDINYDSIHPGMTATDVVFNPPMTGFLEKAAARGAGIITGLGMLVNQGALNFELWTGEKAPYEIMYEALKKEF
ncbi:MAG: shikimate dehydrogenase [Eubacteriales bacterium]|nr:shikimate dehydrogenase [Eubacteriales bacterium]